MKTFAWICCVFIILVPSMSGALSECSWGNCDQSGGGGGKVHSWFANITTNALDLTINTVFDGSGCMLLHFQDNNAIQATNCDTADGLEKLVFPVDTVVTGFYIVLTGTVAAASQCAFQLSDSSDTLFGDEIDIDGDVDTVTKGTVYSTTGLTKAVSAGDWVGLQARESGSAGFCSAQNFGAHWLYITYEDA